LRTRALLVWLYILGFINSCFVVLYCSEKVSWSAVAVAVFRDFLKPAVGRTIMLRGIFPWGGGCEEAPEVRLSPPPPSDQTLDMHALRSHVISCV